jgi:hypothetical protein
MMEQNLEAGVADTIGLGAPPGSVRGQPKNASAVQTSGLVNQLVVASWKHPGRSAPTEDICKPPIYSRVAC